MIFKKIIECFIISKISSLFWFSCIISFIIIHWLSHFFHHSLQNMLLLCHFWILQRGIAKFLQCWSFFLETTALLDNIIYIALINFLISSLANHTSSCFRVVIFIVTLARIWLKIELWALFLFLFLALKLKFMFLPRCILIKSFKLVAGLWTCLWVCTRCSNGHSIISCFHNRVLQ